MRRQSFHHSSPAGAVELANLLGTKKPLHPGWLFHFLGLRFLDRPAIKTPLRLGAYVEADAPGHRRPCLSLAEQADWVLSSLSDELLTQTQLPALIATRKKPIRKPPHW